MSFYEKYLKMCIFCILDALGLFFASIRGQEEVPCTQESTLKFKFCMSDYFSCFMTLNE